MSASANAVSPKIALVTGATGGIGRATCIALAKEGYTLAMHYNSAPEDIRKDLLAKVTSAQKVSDPNSSAGAAFFQADMSSSSAIAELHKQVVSLLGDPTVVYLNAGTTNSKGGNSMIGDISEVDLSTFESTWRVNTLAPYQLAQLCLPAMQAAKYGRVVFCSSVAGITGGVVGPHYASSKSALHGLVHWLAPRVAKVGITVNAIAPALIEETTMLPKGGPELAAKIPVGRFGKPDEIASTVMWMVNNAYVTNKVFAVDGGFTHQ